MSSLAEKNPKIDEISSYLANLGWSHIPLQGDFLPSAPKSPALPSWVDYQHRQPTADERDIWFNVLGFPAIGVVLGAVSGIVAIDIDSPEVAQQFIHALPDLAQTFTVQSGNRGLPHYYYTMDTGRTVPSIRTAGIELRADGHYIVAPNVCINGKTWQVVDDRPPRRLSTQDITRLLDFIHSTKHPSETAPTPLNDEAVTRPLRLSKSALIRRYRRLAPQIGRNNALFNCACFARDCGWSQQDVIVALAPFHVTQPPNDALSVDERPTTRTAEASRTIASAFTRPARPITLTHDGNGLPNAVRESLLQQGKVNVARVLDGLLLCGFRAGEHVSLPHIIRTLTPLGIGRNCIYTALKQIPPQRPPANADRRPADLPKQCLFGRVSNRGQIPVGRPADLFTLPTFADLCERLGVENRGGDALTVAALRSPSAYRAALHAALIQRQPGAYSRRWQSSRLGVSMQTCRRYDRRCGIQVTPRFHETRVTWSNLNHVIPVDALHGQFLMDTSGKRYPAAVGVAQYLLKRGRTISLMVQGANHYGTVSVSSIASVDVAKSAAKNPQITHPKFAVMGASDDIHQTEKRVAASAISPSITPPDSMIRIPSPYSETVKKSRKRSAYADVALLLYQRLKALNPSQAITRKTATLWAKTFGAQAIHKGLALLQHRGNIRNATGFLFTWLRATTGAIVPIQNDAKSTPQQAAPSADSDGQSWLEKMRESPYAMYYANAEDLFAGA